VGEQLSCKRTTIVRWKKVDATRGIQTLTIGQDLKQETCCFPAEVLIRILLPELVRWIFIVHSVHVADKITKCAFEPLFY
jgi:hypothetical protein